MGKTLLVLVRGSRIVDIRLLGMGFGISFSNTYSFWELHSRFEGVNSIFDLQGNGYFISVVEDTFLNLIIRGSIQKFFLRKVPQGHFFVNAALWTLWTLQLRYWFWESYNTFERNCNLVVVTKRSKFSLSSLLSIFDLVNTERVMYLCYEELFFGDNFQLLSMLSACLYPQSLIAIGILLLG